MTSCKACILESLWPYLPLVGASELRHRQLGSRVLGADYDDHDEDRRSWWGPMIMKRTKDHDEDQRSLWGPMILTRTDDHDEDQRSRWGPMIMTRTDDHDEDWWSWWGLMILTRTKDHDEDRWSWRGLKITMRTDDHDEDWRSRWGPMIMRRTDDLDEDRWSRWGPKITMRTDDFDEDLILTWSRWGFFGSRRQFLRSGTGWTRQHASLACGCSTWEKCKGEYQNFVMRTSEEELLLVIWKTSVVFKLSSKLLDKLFLMTDLVDW